MGKKVENEMEMGMKVNGKKGVEGVLRLPNREKVMRNWKLRSVEGGSFPLEYIVANRNGGKSKNNKINIKGRRCKGGIMTNGVMPKSGRRNLSFFT